VSLAAGDGTTGTRLSHRGATTGLSRPLPGPYGFFPVGMPRLPPGPHDCNRRDPSWQHSYPHRHLMRTITAIPFESALHPLAFSKSTPNCSCSHLRSSFAASLHRARNPSTPSLCNPHCAVMAVPTTSGLFQTSEDRLNTHRIVAAQRFSSIHF